MWSKKKISDIGVYLFIEKEWRGDILKVIVKQIANTWKIMTLQNRYNLNHTWIWIIYTGDGWLPYGGFKWLKNVDNFDVNLFNEKSLIGYILEVDLDYSNELQRLHNDYPLTPEKLAISYDLLCQNIVKKFQTNME